MTESTSAVERAIAERIAKVRAEGERRRQERAEFAAARDAGVARRNAAKIQRLVASQQREPSVLPPPPVFRGSPENPTPTQETPMASSPFRSLPCPGCRAQRTVRRVGTVTVSRATYEVLRCPDAGCGLLWLAPPERPGAVAA